jgi:hypothetical protein
MQGDVLQELLDLEAIRALKARYFRLMDDQGWDEMLELFTPDFLFWSNSKLGPTTSGDEPTAVGPVAFVERVKGVMTGCVTVHHGHNPEIRLTGPDAAVGSWAVADVIDHPTDADRRFTGAARYEDEYERSDDGAWRIKRARLRRLHVAPLPLRVEP